MTTHEDQGDPFPLLRLILYCLIIGDAQMGFRKPYLTYDVYTTGPTCSGKIMITKCVQAKEEQYAKVQNG